MPDPLAMLGVWVAGGALAFAGAMAYAELAALRPHAGGEYVYLREAFGRLAAFLTGWTSFVAGFSGAIAASAVALADYLGRFVPARIHADLVPLPLGRCAGPSSRWSRSRPSSLLSLIHVRGLGPGRLVQNILAGLKVSALAGVHRARASRSAHGSTSRNLQPAADAVAAGAWLLALIPVMFSYSGWNAAAYVAEEIRDPDANVPLALALGTVAVIAIYVAAQRALSLRDAGRPSSPRCKGSG